MTTPRRVATQMAFIPGEDVHRSLVDLLNPLATERLRRSQKLLAFYSVNSCIEQDGVESMLLRRFKSQLDETTAPFHSLKYRHMRQPNADGIPEVRLGIDITVDLSAIDQIATQAHQLGFADEDGHVVARLAPRSEDLREDYLYEKSKALEGLVNPPSTPQQAVVKFIQRELTVE